MLGALRRNKNNPIITIVLGAVAVLMIGFGVSVQGGPAGTEVATVDGDGILEQTYAAQYSNAYRQQQSRDPKYDRKRAEADQLRETVLYRMITTKILADEAKKRDLAIDDQALRDEIVNNEAFHVDGKFDKKQYERMLNYMQSSDRNYEEMLRDEMLSEIYMGAVRGVTVSDEELRREWEQRERKVSIEYIPVKKSELVSRVGTVTQEDAKAFKAREGASEQIKTFYTKNKASRYDVPKKVCAAQILVRADKHTPPDLFEEAKEKMKKAHEAVKGGMDFAAAAAKFSDDNNAQKGGDLGCFSVGQMLPQVEEAAFGLKPGEISAILTSNFGFHLVKVNEIKEPVQKKLEDVEDEIALELAKLERASELAKKEAERLLEMAKNHESLEAVATAANAAEDRPMTFSAEKTGLFPSGRDVLPRLGSAPKVAKVAWDLTKEKPLATEPIETDDAWVVVRLDQKVEPDETRFELAKKSLLYTQLIDKQRAVFDGLSKKLRDAHDVEIDAFAFEYDESKRQERAQQRRQQF